MYDKLLLEQMDNLKKQEAVLKKQLRFFTQEIERVWQMQEDILKAVKAKMNEEDNEQLSDNITK